jgi:predicted amidohydrolase
MTSGDFRMTLDQTNPTVGDINGNIALMQAAAEKALADRASVLIFPELSLTGYYPDAWQVGKTVQVQQKRGEFLLYRDGETVPARRVSENDCVNSVFPPPGPYVRPEVACD